jgi:energy-coupling factor transporter transmembrane protein EcfT
MIDVARIDYWAAHGAGPFHRASVPSKLLFLFAVIAASVMARDPLQLAVVYGGLLVAAAASALPWTAILLLSLSAAVFAVLYALSLRGGAGMFALLLLKAVTPAYAAGMVVTSTPYPKLFSFLGAFLPEVLTAGLFMTYRTLFILIDLMDDFATAIRLRGGFTQGSIRKNGSNFAKGIGALLVQAVDRASRLYAVMAVRGYSGSMAEASIGKLGWHDWLPVVAGGSALASAFLWGRP